MLIHVSPPYQELRSDQDPPRPGSAGLVRPDRLLQLGLPSHPKPPGLPSELQNSFHLSPVHTRRASPGRSGGGPGRRRKLLCGLRSRGGVGGPRPRARLQIVQGPGPWVAGDQRPFSRRPDRVCTVSLDMRRRLSTAAATTYLPPHPSAILPTPKQACPSQGRARLPSAGAELGAAQRPQPPRFLCSPAVSRSPFRISTPLPSTGTPPLTNSHPPPPAKQPHSGSCTDMRASSSGKRRAKSLSMMSSAMYMLHGSWLLSPDPIPSWYILLSSLD